MDRKFLKFGTVSIVSGSGVQQLISSTAGNHIFLAAAEIIEVVSSNTNDTLLGTGARKIELIGLDNNYKIISEIIDLNGTTIVETKKSYLRIYRASVQQVGVIGFDKANLGNITFTPKITALEMLRIALGEGQTLTTQYTTDYRTTAKLKNIFADTSDGRSMRIRCKVRNFGTNSSTKVKSTFEIFENNFRHEYQDPIVIPPKSDIWFTVESLLPGGGLVSLKYFMELVQ